MARVSYPGDPKGFATLGAAGAGNGQLEAIPLGTRKRGFPKDNRVPVAQLNSLGNEVASFQAWQASGLDSRQQPAGALHYYGTLGDITGRPAGSLSVCAQEGSGYQPLGARWEDQTVCGGYVVCDGAFVWVATDDSAEVENRLVKMDRLTGEVLWEKEMPERIRMLCLGGDGYLYLEVRANAAPATVTRYRIDPDEGGTVAEWPDVSIANAVGSASNGEYLAVAYTSEVWIWALAGGLGVAPTVYNPSAGRTVEAICAYGGGFVAVLDNAGPSEIQVFDNAGVEGSNNTDYTNAIAVACDNVSVYVVEYQSSSLSNLSRLSLIGLAEISTNNITAGAKNIACDGRFVVVGAVGADDDARVFLLNENLDQLAVVEVFAAEAAVPGGTPIAIDLDGMGVYFTLGGAGSTYGTTRLETGSSARMYLTGPATPYTKPWGTKKAIPQ